MADTFKRLNTTRSFSAATATTIYTVPGATTALIRRVVITNDSGVSATAKLRHVESGGSAGATHTFLPTVTLGVDEHGENDAPWAMAAGDTLVAYGDGSNAVTIHVYGIEVA